MKINRKGFTLIELLVTIVIIGLVVGFSAYGIINVLNESKNKTITLSKNNLIEAARIYSTQASNDSWKNAKDYEAFCVTVGELMNKGLLDNKAQIEGEITKDTYIIVKRNKITLSVEKEEIVSNTVGDENNMICTGQEVIKGEVIENAPQIGTSIKYTDRLEIPFTPGSAKYQDGETEIVSTTTYKCLYGETSANVTQEGRVEGSKCIIDNLKNNHPYYVLIYMNTNHGSSVTAEGQREHQTADFIAPSFSQNKNIITVNYNDQNVYSPSHYFKSTIDGTTQTNVEKCELNNNVFTCSSSTTTIEKDTWYKVADTTVNITYPENNNDIEITARIQDGSNNYKENDEEFIIRKYTVTFNKGSADSIGGTNESSIKKTCLAGAIKGNTASCDITSPTITKNGFNIVGWNTNENGQTSSWNANNSKSITSNETYFPITNKEITITFNKNGATSIGSTSQKCTIWNSNTSCKVKSPTITRSGYTIIGWNTDSGASTSTWNVDAEKSVSSNATYYAITKQNKVTVNANRYKCSKYGDDYRLGVYYVTICNAGTCEYTKLNGLIKDVSNNILTNRDLNGTPTWMIDENSISETLSDNCKKEMYATLTIYCRTGATFDDNTNYPVKAQVKKTCEPITVYPTTTKVYNGSTYYYYYYPEEECYLYGEYLVSTVGEACGSSSGGTGSGCSCTNGMYPVISNNNCYCCDSANENVNTGTGNCNYQGPV